MNEKVIAEYDNYGERAFKYEKEFRTWIFDTQNIKEEWNDIYRRFAISNKACYLYI